MSALNVKYKDTTHIVEILLMAGFWINPIVYAVAQVYNELGDWAWLYWLNPMASVVVSMQRAIYAADVNITGSPDKVLVSTQWSFYLEHLAVAGVISLVVFAIGYSVYRRMSADFAENI